MAAKRRALVVDDERSIRLVLRDLLALDGWDVVTAEDGAEVEDRLSEERFDLIVLDLQMPGMNGFEVLRMLRQASPEAHSTWKTAADVRVVALTGGGNPEALAFAQRVGANATLTKPFDVHEVRRLAAGGFNAAGGRGRD